MADQDLLSIFRVEVSEYLESLNNALLQIEMLAADDRSYQPTLIEMNRVAHSMKGAARAVGIKVIETIAHYMEEVFNAALHQHLKLTPAVCDSLYDGLDLIQNTLEENTDEDSTTDEMIAEVLTRLEQLVTQTAVQTSIDDEDDEAPVIEPDQAEDEDQATGQGDPQVKSDDALVIAPIEAQAVSLRPVEDTVRVTVSKLDRLMAEATELIVARMHSEERQRSVQQLRKIHNKWQREWRSVRTAYIRLVRQIQDSHIPPSGELLTIFKFLETNQRYLSETNRYLTQLVQTFAQDNMHLSTLADQLQNDISRMRLIPFDSVVSGFQRMLRDLARDLDKQVQLEISGGFVEIDKTVLDALKDPLMHLLRNSVDHGIESPVEREERGKSAIGRIQLSVEQRGNEIVIRVSDDGGGIDPARVRRAIVKNKLLSESEAQALNDDEVCLYIFHPGLSTKETVTAVSGRGLGMDIVRDRVESLRGRITLDSVLQQQTTFTIHVPVSLTRIRCILLRVGEQEFAVPSVVVGRMQTVARSEIFTAEGQEMVVINDQPMPCVLLSAVLDLPAQNRIESLAHLLILKAANRTIAFEVDGLLSEQELVLKPLGIELSRARFVSGAALLGNGEIVIVLDTNDLVRAAGGTSLPRRRIMPSNTERIEQRRMRVLIVDDSITTRTLEKNILETAGFDVQVATDGQEAWRILSDFEFDLVISDVEMPHMNGLELTARIKQTAQYQHLPIILLTSLSKPEQREAGLRVGADAYLVKSQFDQGELLETIRAVI
ncbi:MAG: hybrid sensor histidine kinase/response regulator [Anaerolineae bacterium]|jgi:two-component system chemotaxis sensor kinase CheA|nr:hybrid sensor histidine kinase/response regulator [Anaerolineae bacterium]